IVRMQLVPLLDQHLALLAHAVVRTADQDQLTRLEAATVGQARLYVMNVERTQRDPGYQPDHQAGQPELAAHRPPIDAHRTSGGTASVCRPTADRYVAGLSGPPEPLPAGSRRT